MITLPFLRKRVASEPVITADLSAAHGSTGVRTPPNNDAPPKQVSGVQRVLGGLFGASNPTSYTSSAEVDPRANAVYYYHEGDVFTPGTGNYVFDYPYEFPLQTIWGNAFLRKPNTFNPLQLPQIYSNPTIVINGIGGLVAGQFALQGLETDGQ